MRHLWRRGSKQIYWIDPEKLFPVGLPYVPIYNEQRQYNDLTEFQLSNYLEVLPSIALYGFRSVIVANYSYRVLNGDFRVFVARELGLKVPVMFHDNVERYSPYIYLIIINIRRLFKTHFLFFRRFSNPHFKWKSAKIQLVCKFQKNIFLPQN